MDVKSLYLMKNVKLNRVDGYMVFSYEKVLCKVQKLIDELIW